MNSNLKMLIGLLAVAFVLSSAAPVFSQQKQPTSDVMVFQREKVQTPDGPVKIAGPGEDAFWFVSSEMSFDGKVVKGAPYSAQAVTETTQTLADGNRIVNKSTASLYRDSDGRTRREQTLRAIGQFATSAEPPQSIFINDPVTGTTYMMDARTHVARKTASFHWEYKIAPPAGEGVRIQGPDGAPPAGAPEIARGNAEVFTMRVPAPGSDVVMPRVTSGGGAQVVMEYHGEKKNARKESLGKQVVEGVEAEGSRTTVTIPAGEIGNERAIEMVTERWYSTELQTVVMTRHTDPRFGETVYRLTNINRSEPAKTLFEVPADYTIKEGSAGAPMQLRMRKSATDQ